MKAFVINLPEQPERWKRISSILESLKIPYTRQEGIKPETSNLPYCWAFNRDLRRGELGCLLAHKEIWKQISVGTDRYGLVLEDDAVLSPRLASFLNNVENLTSFFDVLKLDGTYKSDSFLTSKKSLQQIGSFTAGELISSAMGTSGYIVSKTGAKKLLDLSKEVWFPVDELLYSKYSPLYSKLSVYQLQQILLWQLVHYESKILRFSDEFESTIRINQKKQKRIFNPYSACRKLFKKIVWLNKVRKTSDKLFLKEDHSEQFSEDLMKINLFPSEFQNQTSTEN